MTGGRLVRKTDTKGDTDGDCRDDDTGECGHWLKDFVKQFNDERKHPNGAIDANDCDKECKHGTVSSKATTLPHKGACCQ